MIQYAGVDLLEAPDSLREWVRANIDPSDLPPYTTHWWPGKNLSHLPFRPPAPPRKIELNTLWWPTGASRFAVGWYLADEGLLTSIRDVTESPLGSDHAASNLVLDDGTDSVTVSMWMLPAIPLQQIGADGLYLLPLVDERYFWWQKGAEITVLGGTTTWAQLYTAIATGLDISITLDAVESAYLRPHAELTTRYDSLPLLLDAVAYSTGRRIVRTMAGTVRAWKPANALAQQTTSLAAVEDKLAGGELAFGADGADTLASAPGSVTMTCFRSDSDSLHAEVVTLTSLALAEYGTHQGTAIATKIVKTSELALYPGPSNAVEITALAVRIATDYYRWQAARASLSIVGYPGWTLTGLEDALELRHECGRIFTRVLRAAFDLETTELLYDSPQNPPAINDLDVMEDDGDPIVYQTTTLQFHAPPFIVTEITAHTALVEPRWGDDDDVQPVGPASDNGDDDDIDEFARVNHKHRIAFRYDDPDDPYCGEPVVIDTGLKIWDCGILDWRYLCWCDPYQPGSGSGSGTGTGGHSPVCDCDECRDGMPQRFGFFVDGADGSLADANGEWDIAHVSFCSWAQTRGNVHCLMGHEGATGRWKMTFTSQSDGHNFILYTIDPFRCCGQNLFVYSSSTGGGAVDNDITISPSGPCTPCGSGTGSGGGITTGCCPGGLPETLYATGANGTGACVCMNGVTVPLIPTYSLGVFIGWRSGAYTGCGGVQGKLGMTCTPMLGMMTLDYYKLDGSSSDNTEGCCQGPVAGGTHFSVPSSSTCDPDDPEFVFPAEGFPSPGGCCTGSFDWVVSA